MPYKIQLNPMELKNQEQRNYIKNLLDRNINQPVFSKNSRFVDNMYDVTLTHTILRASAVKAGQPGYHIVSNNNHGEGGTSTIYPITYDMFISDNGAFTYVQPNPPRVAKVQYADISRADEAHALKNKLDHEYEQSKDGHLNAGLPVFARHPLGVDERGIKHIKIEAFLLMNTMPGVELFALLSCMFNPQNRLTSHFRFLMTFELLDAFYNQVVHLKKSHGDLKPENMLFNDSVNADLNAINTCPYVPQKKINIIDFEGSEYFNVSRQHVIFTPEYAAPEIKSLPIIDGKRRCPAMSNEKTDLFSIAIIIAHFWGVDQEDLPYVIDSQFQGAISARYRSYFIDEPTSFESSILAPIYAAIKCMTLADPAQRWTLEQSNVFFKDIFARYNQQRVLATPVRLERPDSIVFDNCSAMGGTSTPYTPMNPTPFTPITPALFIPITPVLATPAPVAVIDDQDVIVISRDNPRLFFAPVRQQGAGVERVAPVVNENLNVGCGCVIM